MRLQSVLLMVVLTTMIPPTLAEGRYVDLDKPGAMAKLARENPTHYRAVSEIVQAALRQSEAAGNLAAQMALVEWRRIQSTYKAEDVDFPPILLTTDPPKRELSFRLDDVRYRTILRLPRVQAIAEPAALPERGSRPPR
jgi:hypothetical protein